MAWLCLAWLCLAQQDTGSSPPPFVFLSSSSGRIFPHVSFFLPPSLFSCPPSSSSLPPFSFFHPLPNSLQVLPSFWVSFVSVFVLQPRHRWRIYQKPQLLGQVKVQFYGWSKIKFMFLLISQKILTNQKNIHNEESAPRSYLLSKKKIFLIEDTFLVL